MINLETPKKFRLFIEQANQVADNFLRSNSRKYDLAEHEYPKELDLLASLIDGMSDSGQSQGAGATGVRRDEDDDDKVKKGKIKNGTQHVLGPLDHRDVLGRRRPAAHDAAPGPRQLRHRLGGHRRAARAVQGHLGRRWPSPSRASGRTPSQVTDHGGQGRRRIRPQRREDLRHVRRTRPTPSSSGRRSTRASAAPRSSRSSCRSRCRASGWSGSSTSSASAPPTPR